MKDSELNNDFNMIVGTNFYDILILKDDQYNFENIQVNQIEIDDFKD